MATRSTISKLNKDGSLTSIYCHFDGYPNRMIPLLNNYIEESSLDALLSLGDLSFLDETIEATSAYHRDRGEELHISTYTIPQMLKKEQYNYIWINGKWKIFLSNDKIEI